MRGLKHKNVAAELLTQLLKDELKVRSKRNLVQSQLFSEKLKKALNAYHNRAIMLEKHGIACDMLHGSDWKKAVGNGKKTLFALPALQEHATENANGVPSVSPVVARNELPWETVRQVSRNPEGVVAN